MKLLCSLFLLSCALFGQTTPYTKFAGGGLVRRVDSTGRITLFAGGTEFFYVNGLAFDTAGNLIVGDANARRITRGNANGRVTVLVGGGNGTGDGLGTKLSSGRIDRLAVDRNNNIYFTDTGRFLIRRLSPDGMVTTIAGGALSSPDGTPALGSRLNDPKGIAVTPGGKVYFTNGSCSVRTIAADGTWQTVAGTIDPNVTCNGRPPASSAVGTVFGEVYDLAIEPSGKLCITGRHHVGFTEHTFVARIDPNLNQFQALVSIPAAREPELPRTAPATFTSVPRSTTIRFTASSGPPLPGWARRSPCRSSTRARTRPLPSPSLIQAERISSGCSTPSSTTPSTPTAPATLPTPGPSTCSLW